MSRYVINKWLKIGKNYRGLMLKNSAGRLICILMLDLNDKSFATYFSTHLGLKQTYNSSLYKED